MAVSNGSPANSRILLDAQYVAPDKALPTAGSTVNSNGLDLVQATPYPVTERVTLQAVTTAGNGANNKNLSFIVQDSADNITFTNSAGLALRNIQDANNGGYAASTLSWTLQPDAKRYVRIQCVSQDANSGNSANGNLSTRLAF